MIHIEGYNGFTHYVASAAISSVSEAGASSQWHGIRSFVKLFNGMLIESSETPKQIFDKLEAEKGG